MSQAVFATAKNEGQANHMVAGLKAAGFSNSDISVLMPDPSGRRDVKLEQHTKAGEGTAAGAATGVVLGGALGWLAGIGALVIPGLGAFIAAGPIMAVTALATPLVASAAVSWRLACVATDEMPASSDQSTAAAGALWTCAARAR